MRKLRKQHCVLLAVLVGIGFLAAGTHGVLAQENQVSVVLELSQEFFYAGDPIPVRISVRNDGAESAENPVKGSLFGGFRVARRGQGDLAVGMGEAPTAPQRPDSLPSQTFYGAIVDLASIYPGLAEVGSYQIRWSTDGVLSNQLTLRTIPRYDPAKDYVGEIVTDAGSIEVTFIKDQAPIAVKAFIDMANTGLYNGLRVDEVRRDWFVSAGSTEGHPSKKAFRFPAEPSTIPLVAGTMILKPAGAAPPSNSSEFLILLKPQPSWAGQVTVLGQITRGLDLVQKISRLPSTGAESGRGVKPLDDVNIIEIKIVEKRSPA